MNQADLVKITGYSKGMISRIMKGERRFSWDKAKLVAEATGTDIKLWMDGSATDMQKALDNCN